MPPRHHYWTIILEGKPTAFRAHTQEELLPTLRQLQARHPDAVMKWFARGRLWDTQDEERADTIAKRRPRAQPAGDRRPRDWRPGGEHKDPRERFKISRDEKRRRFAENLFRDPALPPEGRQRPPDADRPKQVDHPPRENRPPRFDRPDRPRPFARPPGSDRPARPDRGPRPDRGRKPPWNRDEGRKGGTTGWKPGAPGAKRFGKPSDGRGTNRPAGPAGGARPPAGRTGPGKPPGSGRPGTGRPRPAGGSGRFTPRPPRSPGGRKPGGGGKPGGGRGGR
jgi:23S rRNA pseudouridine2605 synthase